MRVFSLFFSFFSGCLVSNLPSSLPSPGLSCGNGCSDTELVHGAFKEAGFLADTHRQLKVRRRAQHHSSSYVLAYVTIGFTWPRYRSYTVRFSTRHTVARQGDSAVPQSASPFLSQRSPRLRVAARTLAHGPWMSCRSAKWEAGHQTELTCGPRDAIFDLLHDKLFEPTFMQGTAWAFVSNVCDLNVVGCVFTSPPQTAGGRSYCNLKSRYVGSDHRQGTNHILQYQYGSAALARLIKFSFKRPHHNPTQ